MKQPSEDLYQLINSLSQTEKRYFKVTSLAGQRDAIYLKLFEAIEKQSRSRKSGYDEEALKKKFKKEKFVKNFSAAKNYLYNLLIKSLLSYYSDLTIDSQISELIKASDILSRKRLFHQGKKQLDKAKALAEKHDRITSLLQIYPRELDYNSYSLPREKFRQYGISFIRQSRHDISKLENQVEYMYLMVEMFFRAAERKNIDMGTTSPEIDEIINHPLMHDARLATTFSARYHYFGIKILYCRLTKDYVSGYKYSVQRVKIFEDNPEHIKGHISRYIDSLRIQCEMCLYSGKFEKYTEIRTKLNRALGTIPENVKGRIKELELGTFDFDLLYHILSANFEGFDETVERIRKEAGIFEEHMTGVFTITYITYYRVGYIYMLLGKYKQALPWFNTLLQGNHNLLPDFLSYLRIINIILHFELQNYRLLDYLLKSTYRLLSKRQQLFEYERLVLLFIKDLKKISDQKKLNAALKKLKQDFLKIKDNPGERVAFRYFDIISWIDSKIQGRSFLDLYRENWHLNNGSN